MNHCSTLSPSCLLSLAISPFVLGMITVSRFSQTLVEIGQVSEEIFRGDRLPVLPFPEPEARLTETIQEIEATNEI